MFRSLTLNTWIAPCGNSPMNYQQSLLWSAFGCPCGICRDRRKLDANELGESAVASGHHAVQHFPNNVFVAMAGQLDVLANAGH
jgi:hypothetical protein